MESPSAEDRPNVEAQEDSSSVNSIRESPISPSSPKPTAEFARESASPGSNDDAIRKNVHEPEIGSRLRCDDTKDSTIERTFRDDTELSNDRANDENLLATLVEHPENAVRSSSPKVTIVTTIGVTIGTRDVDKIDDDLLFSEDFRAGTSAPSTPSRKRGAADFLPISAEIKRIGVEISEEHAKQLKNDVRRLSPILVSLRERTLGEISLTSDSGLFDDDDRTIKAETMNQEHVEPIVSTGDSSDAVVPTDSGLATIVSPIDEPAVIAECDRNSRVVADNSFTAETSDNASNVESLVNTSSETADSDESGLVNYVDGCSRPAKSDREPVVDYETSNCSSLTSSSIVGTPNDRLNEQRELVIVLSRVDLHGTESRNKGTINGDTRNCRTIGEGADVSSVRSDNVETVETGKNNDVTSTNNAVRSHQVATQIGPVKIDCTMNDLLTTVGDYCLSPKYLKNDQLTRKSPKVVIERTLGSGSPISSIVNTTVDSTNKRIDVQQNKSHLDCIRRSLAENLLDSNDDAPDDETTSELESPEAIEATSDLPDSVYTETETETGSDTSDLNSVTSIRLNACVDTTNSASSSSPDNDSSPSDGITSEIITRLESERPEAFTEDSAESLALATGARDEVRSDGSDSGLGSEIPGDPGPPPAPESDSETSFLDRIPDDILTDKDKAVNQLEAFVSDVGTEETDTREQQQTSTVENFPSPPKSSLKRRLEDCMEGEPSPKRINTDDSGRKKRNIQFDAVTVYYFPRSQGFTCVPSQGGSTLGMSATHTHAERFSLAEHATEQRRIHRARLAQLRSERAANCVTEAASSSEDPSDDTDEEPSDTEELDIDSYYFLQPVPTWQRRALLRAAGVRRIDAIEKDDCRDIRASREHCGCGCKGYCDPESCPCSRANVKCQVDRAGFPCGCSRDGCANSSGRIEFNPVRVRTHFIHTLMRLQLEKKQREEDRTDHELLVHNQTGRGPLREVPVMMTHGIIGPMEHPNVITGDPVSCLNAGGFTTLHYDSHDTAAGSSCQSIVHGAREDSLDLYAIRDDCYTNDAETASLDDVQNSQRKLHPEFGQPFQAFPGQQPGVSFPQGAYQDYQGYQNVASTSRSQFQPQFQTIAVPAASGFTHYAYGQDPNVMQTPCQPTSAPSHHQTIYETPFPQEDNGSAQQQYTNLNSVQPMNAVVQQMGKLEPFSELLAGRYSYYGEVDPQPIAGYQSATVNTKIESEKVQNVVQQPAEIELLTTERTDDCDENFGEIIKKSMVETVSA